MSTEDQKNDPTLKLTSALHWVHWTILALSLVLTILAWHYSNQQVESKLRAEFERECERVIELIQERMHKYEDALWAGVALHGVNGTKVSLEDWKTYTSHIELDKKYPGINGIGVIKKIPAETLELHLENERLARPQYKVHPSHSGKVLYPITYIEPLQGNEKAVGLDMAHESNRLTAIRQARDTGKSKITAPITLVQDKTRTAGFLFYAPIYTTPEVNNLTSRRQHFYGVVYSPFIVKKLMEGTLRAETRHVTLSIKDLGNKSNELIFDEHLSSIDQFDPDPLYRKSIELPLYGRTWTFDIWSSLRFRQVAKSNQSIFILLGGILIDTLLLILFTSFSRSNRKAIAYADRMTDDLQKSNRDLEAARERADEASKAKSEFLANVSHELRTPMNSILGFCRRLMKPKAIDNTERVVDALRTIERNANHLLDIINQILDVSKIEAGEMHSHVDNFDISPIIRDTVAGFAPLAEAKGLRVLLHCSDTETFVRADRTKITQILANLVSNAIKFTEKGSITITAGTASSSNGDEVFSITVEDTGVGIEEEEMELLFSRFTQLSSTKAYSSGGTGLGMSITKDFVELHLGSIEVNSTLGKGTIFSVSLPILADRTDPDLAEPRTLSNCEAQSV
jgi:signal transduction histidine kinase